MKITALHLFVCVFHSVSSCNRKKDAALRVLPNRSQFFQYESVSLSCELQGNSPGWTVKRNTSRRTNQKCFTSSRGVSDPHCLMDDLYPADSGVYWCESAAGECRDAVNITVNAGFVILESPALPVREGDDVTLRCKDRTTSSSSSSSDLSAHFYKDGHLIRSSSTGNLTIHSVSKSDEGLYRCNISGAGDSADSWLTVKQQQQPSVAETPVCRLTCHVVVGSLYLLCTVILGLVYRNRRRAPRLLVEDRGHNFIVEEE